ncbi:MAG: hypothetical protein AMJ69_09960 [Gammaproteobacteria bacterium SG8_47]|nr:MAG: hypothetical protein AMJ69_09960 [Gammaproteobacteria bacterium SG8_47]
MQRIVVLAVLFLASTGVGASVQVTDYMKSYSTKASFEEVREFLSLAVTGRGIKINTVAHIGDMLERTGPDIGRTKQVFIKAEAFEFCTSVLSRDMMEASPHNIVFCPYVIAVYVLPDEPDTVYLSYRRPQIVGSDASRAALGKVETLLDDIIREAIGE